MKSRGHIILCGNGIPQDKKLKNKIVKEQSDFKLFISDNLLLANI